MFHTLESPLDPEQTHIRIFSKHVCAICAATKASLDRESIPYQEINVEEETEPSAEFDGLTPREFVLKHYGLAMPVVIVSDKNLGEITWWSGSRPDLLVRLIDAYQGQS